MASDNSMYNKSINKILNRTDYSGANTTANTGSLGAAQQAIKASAGYDSDAGNYDKDRAYSSGYKTQTPTGTGTGSGNASASAYTGDGGFDLAAYLAEINAQRQAAAEAAYARASAALQAGYNQAEESYGRIKDSGVNQIGRAYNNSLNKLNRDATDAFRQAYVNKMIGEKNLQQRLAALGISGGLSESSLAGLTNSYDKARSNVQNTLDTNIGDLEQNYQSNLTSLINAYNEQIGNLKLNRASQEAQLQQNLANLIASAGGDYFSALMSNSSALNNALKSAVAKQKGYSAASTPTATNTINSIATTQGNDQGDTLTNAAYDAWKKQQDDPEEGTRRRAAASLLAPYQDDIARYANYLNNGITGLKLLDALL